MSTAPKAEYPGQLRAYADREQLSAAAAELFVKLASELIRARGRFRVALSGGSTPREVYELLATDAFSRRVDWQHIEIFWGDESGLRSDDVRGRGYAPRGQTPVVRPCHKRANVGVISAVSNKGELRWMFVRSALARSSRSIELISSPIA